MQVVPLRRLPSCSVGIIHPTVCVIPFQFSGSRIVVPYAPPPFWGCVSGLSQVRLRLPRLSVHIRIRINYAPSLHSHYRSFLTTTADAPRINRSFPTCAVRVSPHLHWHNVRHRSWFLCSLYFSFAYSFSLAPLTRLHHWPVWLTVSDIRPYWFSAVFHQDIFQRRQYPHGGWLYNHPIVYEPYTQSICRLQQNILDMTVL